MPLLGNRRGELALAAVTLIWGASFTLTKSAIGDVSTILFLALRFTLASVVLGIVWRRAIFTGNCARMGMRAGLLAGLCLTVAYFLQLSGLRLTTVSNSAFLTSLNVVLVPLLGALVYRHAPRSSEALGIGTAMLGMGLMTFPRGNLVWNPGDILTIGCAVAFSAHILVVGHWAPRASFAALSFTQIATVAALMISACAWAEPVRIVWSTPVVAALVVTGLLCTALAFSVQAWAQQHISATRTALIFALEPVAAWLTAWLVTGESPTVRAAAGGVLILAGVLAVGNETRPRDPASMDIDSQSSYNKNSVASGRQNENDFV